jgi:hypothetical protein
MSRPELSQAPRSRVAGTGSCCEGWWTQVRRHMIAIGALQRVGHQRIAQTFAPMRRIDTDQRKEPVRVSGMVLRHLSNTEKTS